MSKDNFSFSFDHVKDFFSFSREGVRRKKKGMFTCDSCNKILTDAQFNNAVRCHCHICGDRKLCKACHRLFRNLRHQLAS